VATGFQPPEFGEALKKQSMDLGFVGIRPFVSQSFFHSVADSRKEPRSRQDSFFLAHGTRLPHLGQQGEAGILGDPVVHARRLDESPERSKPPVLTKGKINVTRQRAILNQGCCGLRAACCRCNRRSLLRRNLLTAAGYGSNSGNWLALSPRKPARFCSTRS
jgi:hypothetical protein